MPTPSPKKTPTARQSAPKKPVAEVVVAADAIEPETSGADAGSPPSLRLKDLVDRVTTSTGSKKKGVKEIVESTLAHLGAALDKGEMLSLPGFGRLRIAKSGADGAPMTLKLRRGSADAPNKRGEKQAKEALAEPVDQG